MIVAFHDSKIWLLEITNLSRDAMYIHAGLLIFVTVQIFTRGRFGDKRMLLAVAGVSVIGEILDFLYVYENSGRYDYWQSMRDIINTLIWPVILTVGPRLNLIKR